MEDILFWAMSVATLVGGSLAYYFTSEGRRVRQLMASAPWTKVAEAKDGELVKLRGTLYYAVPPITAPLSLRLCAHYGVTVDRRSGGKDWETIIRESDSCSEFILRDESGDAVIQLERAQIALHEDAHYSSGFFKAATDHLEAFLAKYDEESTGRLFNKTYRYREGTLSEGEQVAVIGRCRHEPDPNPSSAPSRSGYRDLPFRARIIAPNRGLIFITDEPAVLTRSFRDIDV